MVGLQDLQLKWKWKSILWPSNTFTDKTLAGLDHCPHDQLCQSVEIIPAVSVACGCFRPLLPDLRLLRRRDSPAHSMISDCGKCGLGKGIVANKFASVGAER